ncbi:MAG: ABC transporter substrate-binding protein [Prevotella sp.]|nr:ABC transporter substrate-binding protein [Prevotella sp.]
MRKTIILGLAAISIMTYSSCAGGGGSVADGAAGDSIAAVEVDYAKGFTVRDSAGMHLVSVGGELQVDGDASLTSRFALVPRGLDVEVPQGYERIDVPVNRCICMTALQLSNFTALNAHDFVTGITGTKNLFDEDMLQRVSSGQTVTIGMEGNFDLEMVIAAQPDVIFISPSKRGGYDAIRESGITMVPHLGYQELSPLGQAEWVKFIGMFLGREQQANEVFAGIEQRYNSLKTSVDSLGGQRPTITSGEMHYGVWHAVGGRNYLAQIFRDAGADYVINDEETSGEDLEFEQMYALSANADYWRILNSFDGDFSYEALLDREPRNNLLKAFREHKVIYCNMKRSPYYELSPVSPDLLLKDFVAIFHPELVEPDYEPAFYRLLE